MSKSIWSVFQDKNSRAWLIGSRGGIGVGSVFHNELEQHGWKFDTICFFTLLLGPSSSWVKNNVIAVPVSVPIFLSGGTRNPEPQVVCFGPCVSD